MSHVEPAVLREKDACGKCFGVFSRPTLPGSSKTPKHFLKATSWAYLCTECATIVLMELGHGADRVLALREPRSCLKCLEDLKEEFRKAGQEGKTVKHPNAASYLPWCDSCVRIVMEHLAKVTSETTA